MKILFLSQGRTINDHPGWHNALEKLKEEKFIFDFVNIPFYGYAEKFGWNAFYDEVINQCKNNDFQLVYFHYFHNRIIPSPRKCFEAILNLQKRPVVITSAGDGFSDNWMMRHYPKNFKEASLLSDIIFSTQMGKAADKMVKWGTKNIVFAPNSMCQVRFSIGKIINTRHSFKYDVVFVGSYNRKIVNPISQHWYRLRERNCLVKHLVEHYHNRLGLFGKGWKYDVAKGQIPFNEQQKYFRQ